MALKKSRGTRKAGKRGLMSDSLVDQGRSGTLPGRGRAKRVCLEVNWSYRDDSEVGDTTRGYRQTLLGMLSRPRRPEDCAAVTG